MMIKKTIAFAVIVSGFILTILGITVPLIELNKYTANNASIGIIGGADLPTYKYIVFTEMHGIPFYLLFFGISLFIVGVVILIFRKNRK